MRAGGKKGGYRDLVYVCQASEDVISGRARSTFVA